MNLLKKSFSVMLMLVLLVSAFPGIAAFAEDSASTRWADAADEIDKYLDAAFESYLDGDAKTAYDNVSNAYFRVYETTGFERQTMSYVSGNRKNAVEMQFSTCKAAVKKDNTDLETKVKVRSALAKLKSMIREDGNKLAALQGGVQSETKYYLRGELVSSDPYADFSSDPNAAAKYENWYEAATLVKELLDTAYMGYLDKDFEAAEDNINTAYYTVYEESGLNHAIYTDLSLKDRQKMDGHFTALHNLVASAAEKYQKNKYRTSTDSAKNDILKMAKALDTKEEEAKAADFGERIPLSKTTLAFPSMFRIFPSMEEGMSMSIEKSRKSRELTPQTIDFESTFESTYESFSKSSSFLTSIKAEIPSSSHFFAMESIVSLSRILAIRRTASAPARTATVR